jgi:hypothetical protein
VAPPEDFLKADPLQLIGVGVLGLAVPIFFPALRPPLAALLKAGAKLALEAEIDADNALADRLVDTAVDALMRVGPQESERDLHRAAEATVNRFVDRARTSAVRRGWDEQDAAHRYHKRLSKFDRAISRAHQRARAPQRTALEHAFQLLRGHHVVSERLPVNAPRGIHTGKLDHTNRPSQPSRPGAGA